MTPFELGQHLVKVAYAVTEGAESHHKKERVEKMLQSMEQRTGENLSRVPIMLDSKAFFKNLGRYYVPRSIRQIPGKAYNALGTLTTPAQVLLAPELMGHVPNAFEALDSALEGGDAFYSPRTNTVNMGQEKNPMVIAHEIGHYLDLERNRGALPQGKWYKLQRRYQTPYSKQLSQEINANIFANRAVDPAMRKKHEAEMHLALTSYLRSHRNIWHKIKQKEWEGQMDAKGNLPKMTIPQLRKVLETSQDDKERRLALTTAIVRELEKDPLSDLMSPVDMVNGKLVWTGKKTNKLPQIAKALMDAEMRRADQARAAQNN